MISNLGHFQELCHFIWGMSWAWK